MNTRDQVLATRRGVGLFSLEDRGLIAVTGSDRVRWLNGMLSNDLSALQAGPDRSGCYALLLTPKGRIIADLQVLLRQGEFWLETARAAVPGVIERLARYIVADDVTLEDRSASLDRLGIEGPGSAELLTAASGMQLALLADACAEVSIGGESAVVAAFGWSGETSFQLFLPRGSAARVLLALEQAGEATQPISAGPDALEILRIEAGIPRLGLELDEQVLPDEARLDRAISLTKGCYTGQEIVARLHSRGQVNHLLVGLRFAGEPAAPDTELHAQSARTGEGKRTGEVTSSCVSPTAGSIGLGFVRREHAEPGTLVRAGDEQVTVVALPFVHPSEAS